MTDGTWEMLTNPDDPRHGTVNGYTNLACRCDPCKAANTAEVEKGRQRRMAKPIPAHVHGTVNGYRNYGCRLDCCTTANTIASNRRHKERRRRLKEERERNEHP